MCGQLGRGDTGSVHDTHARQRDDGLPAQEGVLDEVAGVAIEFRERLGAAPNELRPIGRVAQVQAVLAKQRDEDRGVQRMGVSGAADGVRHQVRGIEQIEAVQHIAHVRRRVVHGEVAADLLMQPPRSSEPSPGSVAAEPQRL